MAKHWTRHYYLIPTLMFIVAAGGLLALWHNAYQVETRMVQQQTRTTTEQVAFRIENFVGARLLLVGQIAELWERNQVSTPERFGEIARSLESRFGSFQAINWIDPQGVIRWLVPEEPNLAAKDRSLQEHTGLAQILAEAAATKEPRASHPLDLFQGGRGFGTYFPVIRDGHLDGYINGVFRMDVFARDCLRKGVFRDFYLRIEDGPEELYVRGPREVFSQPRFAKPHSLRVLDREWTVTLVPTPELLAEYQTSVDEVSLGIGLVLAAGLALTLKAFLQRQSALQESEQRLRLAVENMPAMVAAFDSAGRIIVWNRHCEQITGYAAGEVTGSVAAHSLLHPRKVGSPAEHEPVFGLSDENDQEWLVTCRDGSVRTIAWSNASRDLTVPGWAAWGVGFDITERRKTEDALQLTQFAMDNAAVATFWIRKDSSLFYVNQAACDSLAYSRDELLRMTVADIDPAYPFEKWTENWDNLARETRPMGFETVHRRKDGSKFPVEITARHMSYKGQEYMFTSAKDISDRKRAEAERLAMERSLLETQRLESLGLLAGGVAHDFNNLLTAMMGTVTLARGVVPADTPLAAWLSHIEAAAQQAADLARQLLAYSGRGKFVVAAVDLRSVIEETGHLLRVSVPKRTVLDFQPGDGPACTRADAAQLRQIVMNLVLNAAEAIGDAEGIVTVRTSTVDVDEAEPANIHSGPDLPAGRYATLEVRDTGPGMDPRVQARIFEPFYSTKATGRGLGLAAVLGIVRSHHGAIRVHSVPGEGTVFQVLLPSCDPPAPASQPTDHTPSLDNVGTILVVDDERSVRTVAKIILEDSGYEVLTAEDGKEGLELFRRHADQIRAVLLDLTMPHMDGREALNEIRQIRPDVRVLLSSGYGEREATLDMAGESLTSFIQKPYRAEQLLRKIQEMLSN